jgi:outer membrane protein OmpA-like peptidoglycan-associated protein
MQRFVVFFQEWSAKLDDNAQAVVAQAAEYARAHPAQFAHVNGFADPTGSRKANTLLTELRAQVVMDQLRQDGVPATHIVSRGHGSVGFALSSQESRRVEISFRTR